jgi:hypothetical protein
MQHFLAILGRNVEQGKVLSWLARNKIPLLPFEHALSLNIAQLQLAMSQQSRGRQVNETSPLDGSMCSAAAERLDSPPVTMDNQVR